MHLGGNPSLDGPTSVREITTMKDEEITESPEVRSALVVNHMAWVASLGACPLAAVSLVANVLHVESKSLVIPRWKQEKGGSVLKVAVYLVIFVSAMLLILVTYL